MLKLGVSVFWIWDNKGVKHFFAPKCQMPLILHTLSCSHHGPTPCRVKPHGIGTKTHLSYCEVPPVELAELGYLGTQDVSVILLN